MSGKTDLDLFLRGQTGEVLTTGGSGAATQAAVTACLRQRRIQIRMPADAAAGTTGTYSLADLGVPAGTVVRLTVVPEAALTADPSNNATITYQFVNGSGGGATAVTAAATTNAGGTGSWVASTRVAGIALTATIANRSWSGQANGVVLQEVIAKGGTGVVVPARVITIDFTEDG